MKALKIFQTFLLSLIGVISVFMTLSVLFDQFDIRQKEGNYVLFIVIANLLCGFIYLYAAFYNWKKQEKALYSLLLASIILILSFVFLQIHINSGGLYEQKTVKVMMFRIVYTIVMTGIGFYIQKKSKQSKLNMS
ncbi:MAG: hypothetical protein IT232_02280 [Flavobacteriales bacterium]|nr:hypothetical protein [Flavobacteriales bacterium]